VPGTPLESAINAFQEQTGITVNVQPTPGDDEYETKMRTLLASGSPPDVMRINDDFVRGYSLAGQLLDLRPLMAESEIEPADYNPHPFNFPVQPDGAHTAWAIGTQPALIVYNVDHFEEAGVPLPPTSWTGENWTWDHFLDAAKKLTIPGERWGVLVVDDTSHETVYPVNNGEATGIYSKDGTQFSQAQFRHLFERRAVDIVQPDIRRAGGLTECLEIGLMARGFNVPYASHGGGAHLHLLAALPNTIFMESGLLPEGSPIQLIDGCYPLPEAPGLGSDRH
jgi:hypothetical protein